MKKGLKVFAAMFCAAMMIGFTACSKDDKVNYEKDIIGSWLLEGRTITQTVNGQTITEPDPIEEGESETYIFREDKTVSSIVVMGDNTFTSEGTYSIKDDKITISIDDRVSTSTLDIDGNKMSLTYTESYGQESISIVGKYKKI